jgi:hypothetical protein
VGTTLLGAGALAALAATLRVIIARGRIAPADDDQFRTRGPLTYAGPGSLGGTESALRR